MESLLELLRDMGGTILTHWVLVAIASFVLFVLGRSFFRVRKVQSTGWDARIFRHEVVFSALTLGASAATVGFLWGLLRRSGSMTFADSPATWYAVAGEFALYFFVFDLYFYAVHRLMHVGPVYRFVHETHHHSTAPNPLTAFSFNPVEGMIAGGFLPLFLAAFEVHREALAVIGPFQILMSISVHCGHEYFPRWWYRTWLTKWFLTPMFHDQHHQLFHCNYGGFTTIWDRVFGTVNPEFEHDFDRLKARVLQPGLATAAAGEPQAAARAG